MNNEKNDLIVLAQLPIIEQQMLAVKADIQARVDDALSFEVNEETYKDIKKIRAELNAEFAALEDRRKAVKAELMKPYEDFEKIYKECAADLYKDADSKLKKRIAEVEDRLKKAKENEVREYFEEYSASIAIPKGLAPFERSNINITMTSSAKSLKKSAKDFLDGISNDLKLIATEEHADEIMVEYEKSLSAFNAITAVKERKKRLEESRKFKEEMERRKAEEEAHAAEIAKAIAENAPMQAPTIEPPKVEEPAPKLFTATFSVTGTLEQLKKLKEFMNTEGINYVNR